MTQAADPRPGPRRTRGPAGGPARLLLLAGLVATALGAFLVTTTDLGGAVVFWAFALGGIGLITRVPRQPIGWLLFGIGLSFVLVGSDLPGSASQVLDGRASLRITLQAWANGWGAGLFFIGLIALAAVFPSGHLPPGRMGTVNRVGIALPLLFTVAQVVAPSFSVSFGDGTTARITNPIAMAPDWKGWPIFTEGIFLVFLAALATVVATLLVRFRRARDAERQQYKWLLAALAGVLGTFVFAFTMIALVDPQGTWMWFPAVVAYPMVPIAIGVAVLRYRLYEIDRIVSRTLAYAIVTAILAAVFAAVVLALQSIARPLAGTSDVGVAISTLVVFALFGPVRRRVQRSVDHRFNRARYDASLVAAGFGARLRDGFDLEVVRAELTHTARASLDPDGVSIWVRTRGGSGSR